MIQCALIARITQKVYIEHTKFALNYTPHNCALLICVIYVNIRFRMKT